MHVTSDYYRGGEHLPATPDSLVEHSSRFVRNTKEIQVEPLRPSNSTMRKLARHYKDSHSPKYST